MGHCFEVKDVSVLYPLKKLQRVRVSSVSNIDELVKNLPQLKYVITVPESASTAQHPENLLREIGSTVVVSSSYFSISRRQDNNIMQSVDPLPADFADPACFETVSKNQTLLISIAPQPIITL
jgi:hypothetical protein